MSERVLAAFATERDLVAAARTATAAGLVVVDAHAPYPISDLVPEASPVPTASIARAALAGGLLGCVGGLLFQAWTGAVSWPIDIGGKPALAWLSFVPVAFELMVLGAAIAAGWAFFRGLRPGITGSCTSPWSAHRFYLNIVVPESISADAVDGLRRCDGFVAVMELRPAASAREVLLGRASLWKLDLILTAVAASALTLAALAWPDIARRNVIYAPDMAASPAKGPYEGADLRAGVITLRSPVIGTVPRGALPLHFEASDADALRAGLELQMPASIAVEADAANVAKSFAAFCQPCHGRDGHGDGITIKRGFQPPPSLLTQRSREMKDGQMFHVLTYGQKLMPSHASQLAVDERWRLIRHMRRLQERLPVDPPPFGTAQPMTPSPP